MHKVYKTIMFVTSHPLAPETRNDILPRGIGGSLGQGVWHKALKQLVGPKTRNDLVIGPYASGLISTENVYESIAFETFLKSFTFQPQSTQSSILHYLSRI